MAVSWWYGGMDHLNKPLISLCITYLSIYIYIYVHVCVRESWEFDLCISTVVAK